VSNFTYSYRQNHYHNVIAQKIYLGAYERKDMDCLTEQELRQKINTFLSRKLVSYQEPPKKRSQIMQLFSRVLTDNFM
jgi:hypothetical protein